MVGKGGFTLWVTGPMLDLRQSFYPEHAARFYFLAGEWGPSHLWSQKGSFRCARDWDAM